HRGNRRNHSDQALYGSRRGFGIHLSRPGSSPGRKDGGGSAFAVLCARGTLERTMAAAPKSIAAPLVPRREWFLPIAAVAIVFVMLVPVPAFLLDLLLATSITLAVIVLLASLQILRPAEFSVFPTLLLMLTLFRLALNLASTRRILLHGNEGTAAAGRV